MSSRTTRAVPMLIETKLAPAPQASPWVERPRLIDSVIARGAQSAILLCAPAGYGKTIVMSQAFQRLAERGEKVGWVSFDRYDATPVNFLRYVMAAIRRACPSFGESFFGFLDARAGADLDFYLDVALAEIAALDERVTIFLDDLHYASTATLPEMIEAMIRFSSSSVRYVLSTRDQKNLEFWQLRAESRLQLVDAKALAFDEQEAFDYFAVCAPRGIDAEQVEKIFRATEGWGMGLQLARLALARLNDPADMVAQFSGRNQDISGYLLQNVLDAQAPEIRTFLLKTSLLDRLCAENCDALLNIDASGRTIAYLEHANLFLISLDADGKWFRYHHLFQEFLQRQLALQLPNELAALRRVASQWFCDHRLAEEALDLALATGDMQFTAETLAATCDTLAYTGNHSAFRMAIDAVPRSILAAFPQLALDQVWLELMNWNFREARHLLALVTKDIDDAHNAEDARLGEALLHRRLMMAFHCGDIAQAAELCERWLERYPMGERFVMGSVYIVLLLSRSYLMDNAGLATAADKAKGLYQDGNRRNAMVWHNCITGLTFEARGELRPALQAYTDALSLSKHLVGAPPGVLAMPAIFTAQVYYEQNELDKARWLIDANPARERPGGLIEYVVAYILTRAKIQAVADNYDAAAVTLADGLDFAASYGLPHVAKMFAAERIRQALLRGHVDEARCFATEAGMLPNEPVYPSPKLTIWDAAAVIAWGRVMLATGQYKTAQPVLRRWSEYCATRGSARMAVVFALLTARARMLSGEVGGALRVLAPAISTGMELGLMRTFIDEGSALRPLLLKLYESAGLVEAREKVYTRTLLSALSWRAPLSDVDPMAAIEQGGVQTSLSTRELEILLLMSQGIKGSFVGSRLGITEGTVKWHMQRIFDKLGVRNRREAIDRARTLGMLAL
ncbi:LuxR C-terminal-related transcriptional regulator [Pandoraea sp. PE-S2R-1]|uniref:LuxR C-terminal-related transcriptional regulator n=1 Tax=Pandoraea sp. PE-S2R-1 TaxID=1986994 RepID=UPI000B3F64FB|nr:LuxR C-terminal-related transcriptional regulator [Pandoraea sp. PE-S2R-1]